MDVTSTSGRRPGGPATQSCGRELSADLYRVAAVLVVVVGHWLAASVTFRNGLFGNEDVLAVLPWTQWLTWIFQVVPVFFLVGGYANAVSWLRWRDGGGSPQDWYRHRLAALLGPTTVYVAVVLAAVAVLVIVKVNGATLALSTWAIAMHLWFVPVYLVVVALTPAAVAAQRRWGLATLIAATVAVGAVDLATRGAGLAVVGVLNYVLCWGAIYQIGIAWHGGAMRGRRPLLLAIGSAGVLAVLVALRLYPISMVGVAGAAVRNTSPPGVAMLAFAAAQSGLLVAAAPALTRWLRQSRWRGPVAATKGNVMGLYLWHMLPVIAVALIVYPAGLLPQPTLGSAAWWLLRAAWVAMLSLATAAELTLMWYGRAVFSRRLPSTSVRLPPQMRAPLLVAGVALALWTLSRFAADGFAANGLFPVANALLYATGIALIVLVPSSVGQHTPGRWSDRPNPNSFRTPLHVRRPRIGFPLAPSRQQDPQS